VNASDRTTTTRQTRLSTVDLDDLRRRLEEEQVRLAALYRDDVRRERAIEFGEAEDVIDRTVKSALREEESALAESEREQLRLVEEALTRMREGSYGLCLQTGEPIPLARLRAVPWARYALEVQEHVEKETLEAAAPGRPPKVDDPRTAGAGTPISVARTG
jgi:DnaK suppressor protein